MIRKAPRKVATLGGVGRYSHPCGLVGKTRAGVPAHAIPKEEKQYFLLAALFTALIIPIQQTLRASPPPDLQRSLVASGQGYFPVALRLQDGRIAVVMRGGGPHLSIHGRLDMVFSSDEGKTWSKPTVVLDSPLDDRNPALGQAADGAIVVAFWRTANYDDQGRYNEKLHKPVNTWVTRSTDGGKSWSEAQQIDVSNISWGSPYGKMITLPDGAMLMSMYGGAAASAPRTSGASYLCRSTDNGKTWQRFSTIASGYNETGIARLGNGDLLAALRSDKPQDVSISRSTDGGKTWSTPAVVTPANVHPADLLPLPDGRVLITCGYRVGPTFGVCALLSDANATFNWKNHFTLIDDATNRDCGYPSSILLKDGRVLTVYYAVGSKEHPEWQTHCGAVVYPAH
jgi:Neuraminidase (sialidase)